jgi:hypothetical protein
LGLGVRASEPVLGASSCNAPHLQSASLSALVGLEQSSALSPLGRVRVRVTVRVRVRARARVRARVRIRVRVRVRVRG